MAHFYELSSCFKASLFQQPVQLFYCDVIYPLYASIYRVLKLLKTHTLLIICLAIEQFIVPCYVCLENLSMDMFFFYTCCYCCQQLPVSCGWFGQTASLRGGASAGGSIFTSCLLQTNWEGSITILYCGYRIFGFKVNKYFY